MPVHHHQAESGAAADDTLDVCGHSGGEEETCGAAC